MAQEQARREEMNKQNVEDTDNGILCSPEEGNPVTCHKVPETQDVMLSEINSHKRTNAVLFYSYEVPKAVKPHQQKHNMKRWCPRAGLAGKGDSCWQVRSFSVARRTSSSAPWYNIVNVRNTTELHT